MEDVRFIAEAKMAEPVAGIDAEEENESLSPNQRDPPTARKLLLHNAALRRNFEHLKQLFTKLSKANQKLQETCRRLQSEKDQGHGGDMILETDEHTTIFPNKGKDIFTKEIEMLRLERDQVIAEKEAVELEYIKLVSMKGEEKEKCKYLEIDLETACVAGEAAHGQLLKVAYEKDMIILDLEKATQKLQENIRILEEEKETEYSAWHKEKQDLIKIIDEIERDKANQIEMSQTLKSEIADLHGMLNAMESSTQDAEIRHANAFEFIKQESKLLKEDLDKARKDLKLAKETILKSQKEITEMHEEAAGLRAQLQDALNDARLYQQNGVDCMHANEQLRQSLLGAQENIAELIKARKDDEIFHLQQLKDSQMGWELERTKLLETVNKDSAQRIAKLTKQNHVLRKRLKQSYQVLAVMTCDCNRLKDELSAKAMVWKEEEILPEEAPTKKVATLERESAHYGPCLERGDATFKALIGKRMEMRLALELAGKSHDLPTSSNANHITIRLIELGVLHCRVDVDELQKQGATLIDKTIRDFGYDYWEIVTLAPHLVDNFKELTDKFYHEHLHPYDESRIILEGNGYWDISDYDGTMIRFRVEKGDMITLPPGMYHRFTMDTNDHMKANAL
ncbi:hypothetical protein L7F22_002565 [Adiantum nelumboides]|nr:hypothetical protein [Adiantum nelumboides]